MKNISLMNKVVAGLITGGILLSASGLAYATTNTTESATNSKAQHGMMNKENKGNFMKTKLDKLVTAGTITQDTADKIIAFEAQKQTDMKAEMAKVKSMTPEERKAYFAANPKVKADPFADLVKAGILTQAQADTIIKAFLAKTEKGDKENHKTPGVAGNGMKTHFDALVKAGTITQDTEDKIIAFQAQKQADRKTEMVKIKAMTPEERKAYFATTPKEKSNLFADLVKAGILTQAEADSIIKTIPAKVEKGNHNFKSQGKMKTEKPTSSTTQSE